MTELKKAGCNGFDYADIGIIKLVVQSSLKCLITAIGRTRIYLCYYSVWLAHLVSLFACNTRVIVDASSNPLVSNVKSL